MSAWTKGPLKDAIRAIASGRDEQCRKGDR
jgi:hypothetical protein